MDFITPNFEGSRAFREFNPCHEPGGKDSGGQFASKEACQSGSVVALEPTEPKPDIKKSFNQLNVDVDDDIASIAADMGVDDLNAFADSMVKYLNLSDGAHRVRVEVTCSDSHGDNEGDCGGSGGIDPDDYSRDYETAREKYYEDMRDNFSSDEYGEATEDIKNRVHLLVDAAQARVVPEQGEFEGMEREEITVEAISTFLDKHLVNTSSHDAEGEWVKAFEEIDEETLNAFIDKYDPQSWADINVRDMKDEIAKEFDREHEDTRMYRQDELYSEYENDHPFPDQREWVNDNIGEIGDGSNGDLTSVSLKFYITDLQGQSVAYFQRILNPDQTVYHAYFKVGKSGEGLARALLKGSIETYVEHGFKQVNTQANIDIGSYTWPRFGFAPRAGAADDIRRWSDYAYQKIATHLPDNIKNTLKTVWDSNVPDKYVAWNVSDARIYTTPEIAREANLRFLSGGVTDSAKRFDKMLYDNSEKGVINFGLLALHEHSWPAKLDLRDPQHMRRLRRYIGGGG